MDNVHVAFYHVNFDNPEYYEMAEMMVASARRAIPGCTIHMLTDCVSPAVKGIDHIVRAKHRIGKEVLNYLRLEMMRNFLGQMPTSARVIFVDTDIIFTEAPDAFEYPFDMALTYRRTFPSMPFNFGVIFCRNTLETRSVITELCEVGIGLPNQLLGWYVDQLALILSIGLKEWEALDPTTQMLTHKTGALLRFFPCDEYNHSPDKFPDYRKPIMHFKGPRKQWMTPYWKQINGAT